MRVFGARKSLGSLPLFQFGKYRLNSNLVYPVYHVRSQSHICFCGEKCPLALANYILKIREFLDILSHLMVEAIQQKGMGV